MKMNFKILLFMNFSNGFKFIGTYLYLAVTATCHGGMLVSKVTIKKLPNFCMGKKKVKMFELKDSSIKFYGSSTVLFGLACCGHFWFFL